MRNSILIADDQDFVRAGLRRVIEAHSPEWEIVAEADNALEAAAAVRTAKPNVAIVDFNIPAGGVLTFSELVAGLPIHLIVLAEEKISSSAGRLPLLGAGAEFLLKTDAAALLAGTIERIRSPADSAASHPRWIRLSAREAEIARFLASGETNNAIALRLGLSVRTIEAHRLSIRRKLGINSVDELRAR